MKKRTQFNITYALIALLGVFILQDLWVSYSSVAPLAYSEFESLLKQGKVKEIVITTNEIRGELKEPDAKGKKYFKTTRVDNELAQQPTWSSCLAQSNPPQNSSPPRWLAAKKTAVDVLECGD